MEIDQIIKYEQGELDDMETLNLFSSLIKNGNAWTLQGHYGRTAKYLIDNNYIDNKGQINYTLVEELL